MEIRIIRMTMIEGNIILLNDRMIMLFRIFRAYTSPKAPNISKGIILKGNNYNSLKKQTI